MKAFLSMLLLASLVSCGDDFKDPEFLDIETIRDSKPVIDASETSRILKVCDALKSRAAALDDLSSSGTEYRFDYAQKGCTEAKFPESREVITEIEQGPVYYTFSPTNNEDFAFTEIDTPTRGILKEICQFQGTLRSPIPTSLTTNIYWTTFTDSDDCKESPGTLCVHLQKGSQVTEGYKIHTWEWLKFRVTEPRVGFFLERKRISKLSCSKNQTFQIRATLK